MDFWMFPAHKLTFFLAFLYLISLLIRYGVYLLVDSRVLFFIPENPRLSSPLVLDLEIDASERR